MLELAKKVVELTNSKSEIVFKDLPMDDPRKRKPDIELAISRLNWIPKIDIDLGLKKTIAYFESVGN
jgi:nucleoside-diphosphate-sugar epimerase